MIDSKNCETAKSGTGLPACLAGLGQPKGVILTSLGWSEDVETTIDKDYIVQKIQEKVFIPFINATGFEQTTPEATTQEFQDGTILKVRDGKPQYSFNYVEQVAFQKVATAYDSHKQYKAILVFDNDVMFLANNGTKVSGFSLGMFSVGTYLFNTGSESGYTPIMMQLLDKKQFDNGSVLDPEFDLTNEVNGIIDATITGMATAGGDVVAEIKATANKAFDILGLTVDNFRLIVNGVAESATAVTFDDVANSYEITPTSTLVASDTVVVELYDSTISASVAKVGDQLYQGKSSEIVTA